MKHASSLWFVMGLVSMLLTAGCSGAGGGGLFGFFGGDSGTEEILGLFASGGSDVVGGGGSIGDLGGGGLSESLVVTSDVATVHNPEPASLALFGSGLIGLAHLRRRKVQQTKTARR